LFVEIWRNGTFAGSTICDINGLYSVLVTLVPGSNALVARDRDALGQYGPDSAVTTVTFTPPAPTPTPTPSPAPTPAATPAPPPAATPQPTSTPTATPAPGAAPLLLQTDRHNYQGANPDEAVEWLVKVSGGRTPYSITWSWGDNHTDSLTVGAAGSFQQTHQYSQSGVYQIVIRVKDAAGREAALQLVAVVGGTASPATIGSSDQPGNLIFVWPLIILLAITVGSFWLGERHELSVVRPLLIKPTG
jgi:hypothetical protein